MTSPGPSSKWTFCKVLVQKTPQERWIIKNEPEKVLYKDITREREGREKNSWPRTCRKTLLQDQQKGRPAFPMIIYWGVCVCVCVWVCESCLVMSDSLQPHDYSSPGSSVHGILQARKLEWVAIPILRGCSWSRDQTGVSRIAGRFFTIWATWEALTEVITSKKQDRFL